MAAPIDAHDGPLVERVHACEQLVADLRARMTYLGTLVAAVLNDVEGFSDEGIAS
jgi:hypothetical protein